MNEVGEVKNGNGEQEKIGSTAINQSINQSSVLYLVKNENLQKLLDGNSELKKEVEKTEKVINTKLKIKTIKEFDEIVDQITKLGFETVRNAEDEARQFEIQNKQVKTEKQLESYIKIKKFFSTCRACINF